MFYFDTNERRRRGDEFKIDPSSIAFDIDGVVADTMTLFLDIAKRDYNIEGIEYDDITCYWLEDCLDLEPEIIESIIEKMEAGDYQTPLKPLRGAPGVLSRLSRRHSPVLFVTARHKSEPISGWISSVTGLDEDDIEVVATGLFDAKTEVLLEKNISYFVEDRLETCYPLEKAGITPILFKQPWNRGEHPFMEVGCWDELEAMIRL